MNTSNHKSVVNKSVFSTDVNVDLAPDGKVFVEGVWEGSAADRAGIRVGDRVVSFDSREATTGNILKLVEIIKDRGTRSFVLGGRRWRRYERGQAGQGDAVQVTGR